MQKTLFHNFFDLADWVYLEKKKKKLNGGEYVTEEHSISKWKKPSSADD